MGAFESYTNKDARRFFNKVDTKDTDQCWEWKGWKSKYGYGMLHFQGKSIKAHRFSYRLYFGTFDESKVIRHQCNNTSCVSPFHLEIGTQADNNGDKLFSGRKYSNNKTGYPGIYQTSDKRKYVAQVSIVGSQIYIGVYDTAEQAHQARTEYLQALSIGVRK